MFQAFLSQLHCVNLPLPDDDGAGVRLCAEGSCLMMAEGAVLGAALGFCSEFDAFGVIAAMGGCFVASGLDAGVIAAMKGCFVASGLDDGVIAAMGGCFVASGLDAGVIAAMGGCFVASGLEVGVIGTGGPVGPLPGNCCSFDERVVVAGFVGAFEEGILVTI